jgi:hypothetical protein
VLAFFSVFPGTILDLVRASKREDFPTEAAYVSFQQRASVRALALVQSGELLRELRPSANAQGVVQDQWHYWKPDRPVAPVARTRRDEEIERLKKTVEALTAERDSLLEMLDEVTAPAEAA